MNIKLAIILCLLLVATSANAELTFYTLSHKTASDIIPSIKPFLQADETVGAARNELILRVHANNLADIKRLIKKLDQPSHRLIIYVNRNGKFDQQTEGYNVNSRVKIGVGSGVNSSYSGKLKVYSTTDSSNNRNNQSIHVLEGHTAHISEGVSEPITNFSVQQYAGHSHISSNTNYKDASNGFYVTPRLANDSVILDIAPWYESPLSENRSSAKFIRASSVVRGRLNTWIELAGIHDNSSKTSSKILGRHVQTNKRKNTIWVKVVDLDARLTVR
ncbi:MAG TPA: nodulation protein NolW [Cycloclasticus sp.]|jgi:type II secretory pathway component GspD/PulD (secretin)|nr:nodulation protein NolW [Cycloclasticus sp.]HIL91585.1 nodulation protein NolW [Cycloclasticus sp.]